MNPDWYERQRQLMDRFDQATYDTLLREAVMFANIVFPLAREVRIIVGYDPQRLLPAPDAFPFTGRWGDSRSDPVADLQAFCKAFMAEVYQGNMHVLFPRAKPPTLYEIEGGQFFMQDPGTFDIGEETMFDRPTRRRLTPYVTPIPRFKMAYIDVRDTDYGVLEARILSALAMKDVRALTIYSNRPSGDIAGSKEHLARLREAMTAKLVPTKTQKQNGRSADYLARGGFASKRYRK